MRQEMHLDEPEEPDDLFFTGFPLPYRDAMLAWRAYHSHGVLPFAGGSLDQPAWWWEMVSLMNEMYYVRWYENKAEADAEKAK